MPLLLVAVLTQVCASRADWVPVQDIALAVEPGSPLDFSALFSQEPAGSLGRVVAGRQGQLEWEQHPGVRARFHCASLAWSPASGGFPDQPTADLYAAQLRMHGYNIARFHFVEANLMTGRTGDFDYDPELLDRFRYLMAALKREGIYWIIDVMTSPNGAIGNVQPERWTDRYNLKVELYTSDDARRHWRRLAETLLATLNPYTGQSPLADPALAALVLVNENGLEFDGWIEQGKSGHAYPALLEPRFNRWLSERYADTEKLRAAWGRLSAGEQLERASVRLPSSHGERGPRMRDTQLFFRDLEAENFSWLERQIRELGYKGLVTAFNTTTTAAAHATRSTLPLVTMNTYFDEVLSYEPGVTISQKSSLEDAAGYLRAMFTSRWLARPFVLTEYDQPFWNSYRYESGLAAAAYAGLQGWDAICRHGTGPIDLSYQQPWPHKRAMLPYVIGLDPVARAGETLAALLLRRGDVARARSLVAVGLGAPERMLDDGQGQMPSDISHLGLIARIGLVPGEAAGGWPLGSIRIDLDTGAAPSPGGSGLISRLSGLLPGAGSDRLPAHISRLQEAGALARTNRSDPAHQVYESDTGEILLDAAAKTLQLVTPRTEAAAFAVLSAPRDLGVLRIESSSGPALIAVSALDDAPIRASRRLLLIFATDAVNTGMKFRDAGRRTIMEYGRMPVLIRREKVELRLRFSQGFVWALTSLHLDGRKGTSLPSRLSGHDVAFTLDNAATGHGPTTFFLLER